MKAKLVAVPPAAEAPPPPAPDESACTKPQRVSIVDLMADPKTYDGKCISVRAVYYDGTLWRGMDMLDLSGIDELPVEVKKYLMGGQKTVTMIGRYDGTRAGGAGSMDHGFVKVEKVVR
ncbi:MAG: hypothetical protein HYV07_03925 [Deltaproteobacteria bacterium]|nr:hypothetical protein [Deltaproteobacteria bacterium]